MTQSPVAAIRLEVFKHLFAAVSEEMGVILRRSSYSPNIKERRDFSCALFDPQGDLVAQAAHIPVHLGSMPLSVHSAIRKFSSDSADPLVDGDMILLNDPYQGGTHLPDITLVSPVFQEQDLLGYVASRAHHADIGGLAPGSMAIAREIYQEGLIIPPIRLARSGIIDQAVLDLLAANVRTPQERLGDLRAQMAANHRGAQRLSALVNRYGLPEVRQYMAAQLDYAERMMRSVLRQLPAGIYRFSDALDDDGVTAGPIPIAVRIEIAGDHAVVDFSGSAPQTAGSLNAVYAITLSAVYYVFRCLLPADVPSNAGCLRPIRVHAPLGSVVNALPPAPVAGGNVETSQRIVDVLLGALAQACPERIPAASQGTMNNLTIGGQDFRSGHRFTYYETIAGGTGARPQSDGPSAVHSHMTNTLNTPVEALEFAYPLHVVRYEVRRRTGGEGRYRGGDGIRRDIQALVDCQASFITERRQTEPYGLSGGSPGMRGENILIRDGIEYSLPGKGSIDLRPGDIISIRTPGGGGHGNKILRRLPKA